MMKQLVLLLALLLGVMGFVYWSSKPGNLSLLFEKIDLFSTSQPTELQKPIEKKYIQIGANRFEVILAKTQEQRRVGLSKHKSLPQDTAMLFVFEEENVRTAFWMKGMKFPIDIIWINEGKVSQIESNVGVAEEGVADSAIPYYVANEPFDFVVEVNAGVADKHGVKTGDSVILPL